MATHSRHCLEAAHRQLRRVETCLAVLATNLSLCLARRQPPRVKMHLGVRQNLQVHSLEHTGMRNPPLDLVKEEAVACLGQNQPILPRPRNQLNQLSQSLACSEDSQQTAGHPNHLARYSVRPLNPQKVRLLLKPTSLVGSSHLSRIRLQAISATWEQQVQAQMFKLQPVCLGPSLQTANLGCLARSPRSLLLMLARKKHRLLRCLAIKVRNQMKEDSLGNSRQNQQREAHRPCLVHHLRRSQRSKSRCR